MNPMQMVTNLMTNRMMNNNPMLGNLVKMAKSGDSNGVEQFARNLYKEQGRDFDKEMEQFLKQIGSK